jgi:hypothetical protein
MNDAVSFIYGCYHRVAAPKHQFYSFLHVIGATPGRRVGGAAGGRFLVDEWRGRRFRRDEFVW